MLLSRRVANRMQTTATLRALTAVHEDLRNYFASMSPKETITVFQQLADQLQTLERQLLNQPVPFDRAMLRHIKQTFVDPIHATLNLENKHNPTIANRHWLLEPILALETAAVNQELISQVAEMLEFLAVPFAIEKDQTTPSRSIAMVVRQVQTMDAMFQAALPILRTPAILYDQDKLRYIMKSVVNPVTETLGKLRISSDAQFKATTALFNTCTEIETLRIVAKVQKWTCRLQFIARVLGLHETSQVHIDATDSCEMVWLHVAAMEPIATMIMDALPRSDVPLATVVEKNLGVISKGLEYISDISDERTRATVSDVVSKLTNIRMLVTGRSQ